MTLIGALSSIAALRSDGSQSLLGRLSWVSPPPRLPLLMTPGLLQRLAATIPQAHVLLMPSWRR